MDLKFEIKDNQILRKNIQVLASENTKCFFDFQTKEWWGIEKYAIFWIKEEKNIIVYLGKDKKCKCKVPKKVTEENIFSIQVYANNKTKTQKLKIGNIPKGYTITKPQKCKKNKRIYKNDDAEIILYSLFSRMENKIDNIVYEDGYLKCFSETKLVCKTPIFKEAMIDIRKNIKDLMPYFEVEDDGSIYAVYPYKKE